MMHEKETDEENPADCIPLKEDSFGKSQSEENNEKSNGDSWFLYFATFAGSLAFLVDGICMVWHSPVVPQLVSNDNNVNPMEFPITKYDVTTIGVLYPIGCILSPIIFGKLIDAIGSKTTAVVMGIINTIFFLVLSYSTTMLCIWSARLMIGMCTGTATLAMTIFLSEITQDHNRGKFGCFLSVFLPLGHLYGYFIGPLLSVRNFTFVCMIPLVLHCLLLFFFIPESPIYLIYKSERNLTANSLKRYRGNPSRLQIEKEIDIIQFNIEKTIKGHRGGIMSMICHKPSRRGFAVGLGMFLIKSATGVAVMSSFIGPMVASASDFPENLTVIVVAALKVLVIFVVAQIVERIGRKPLMLMSIITCSISLFFLGIYFFVTEQSYMSSEISAWLSIISLLAFILAHSIGAEPIPTATIGELFASNVRSTAVSTVYLFARSFDIALIALYPIAIKYVGNSGCMWIFCGFSVLGAVFIHEVMPETKARSIYGIQAILNGKK